MKEVNSQGVETATYKLAGLWIVSDLPLSLLTPCQDKVQRGHQIIVRRARVPDSLLHWKAKFFVAYGVGISGQCNETEMLLNISGVARYLIRNGKEVLVDQASTATLSHVCAFLLGTVFGVLCHQRGMTPLHGSAIDVPGGCVVFVGDSGAGKSTLAAALSARGHQVIADDLSCLQLVADGNVMCWPGVGRIRLWEDAAAALGFIGTERESHGFNKYLVPVPQPESLFVSRRLQRIYHLNRVPFRRTATVSQVRGAAAIELLMKNVYRLSLAEYMGRKPALVAICAALAGQIPIFQLSQSIGFDTLRENIKILEDHWSALR
jgi:energy-coupling factor transporter ATP-binding protein EcfA2